MDNAEDNEMSPEEVAAGLNARKYLNRDNWQVMGDDDCICGGRNLERDIEIEDARAILTGLKAVEELAELRERLERDPAGRALLRLNEENERLTEENEQLRYANRTRPDYDLRCQECGAAHNVDTSIPSELWNAIAPAGGILCTLCIDSKLAELGLVTDAAEFYFVGTALKNREYAESTGAIQYWQGLLKQVDGTLALALEGNGIEHNHEGCGSVCKLNEILNLLEREQSRPAPPVEQPDHDGPCVWCGEPTSRWAANPGLWPILLPWGEPLGVVKWHHSICVLERLHIAETVGREQPAGTGAVVQDFGDWQPQPDLDAELPKCRRCNALIYPEAPVERTWSWALEQIKEGKMARRRRWANGALWLAGEFPRFMQKQRVGTAPWRPSLEDFEATDWQLAEGESPEGGSE